MVAAVNIAVLVAALASCAHASSSTPDSSFAKSDRSATAVHSTAASGSRPATTAVATAPAPGKVLATIDNTNGSQVVSNPAGIGFDVINGNLQSYDAAGRLLATIPQSEYTPDCGAADVMTPSGRVLLTDQVSDTRQAGIHAATYSVTLSEWNAATGARLWADKVVPAAEGAFECKSTDQPGGLYGLSATTRDGRWGVFNFVGFAFEAIDLRTGKVYPRPNLVGVIGNYAVIGTADTVNSDWTSLSLTLPGPSWQQPVPVPSSLIAYLHGHNAGDLAPAGFVQYYMDEYPNSATTPDGKVLITQTADSISARSLPQLRTLWVSASSYGISLAAVNDSTILVDDASGSGGFDRITAISVTTGKKVWSVAVPGGLLCELSSTQILLSVGDGQTAQLATLDAATGRQLSYQNDPYPGVTMGMFGCPTAVGSGLSGVGWSGDKVIQLIAP